MHFRHVLITGLMVGAAMFLPNHAFAEKNELSGQQHAQKASEQASLVKAENVVVPKNQSKAENAKSLEKTVVVPETAKSRVNQQPSNVILQQATAHKRAVAQAKGNSQSAVKKVEEAVTAPKSKKVAAVQGDTREVVKKELAPKKAVGKSSSHSFTDTDVKDTSLTRRPTKKVDQQRKSSHEVISTREKAPSGKNEIPLDGDNQAITPPQRTSSSGEQTNERVTSGLSTISLIDKWFEWNKHNDINLVLPFHSRYALLNNQWVNAPPSPPPQEAPLLKTVYRS